MGRMPIVFAAATAACLGLSATAPARDACDRACMAGVLDRYVAALIKHDPAAAPIAASVRSTENGAEVGTGDGLWQSLGALGPVQRRYIDTASGQAALLGVVIERGEPALLSLRVKFSGSKIAESETVVARKGELLYNPVGMATYPPRPERYGHGVRASSRWALIATANAYFNALSGSAAPVPKIDGCERLENGTNVTRSMPGRPTGAAADEAVRGDCTTGLTKMPISAVAHRRFVVDSQSGVVLGVGLFQRPPGAVWRDGTPRKRNLIHEYFVLDGGRIAQIYAVMHYIEATDPDSTGW